MSKSRKGPGVSRAGAGVLSILLALVPILFNRLLKREIVVIAIAIAICLVYAGSGWASRAGTSGEKIGRWIIFPILSAAAALCIGWYFWPPPSFVYIKPGLWMNPNSPNEMWSLDIVVRGPQPAYNVNVSIEDAMRQEEIRRKLTSATSDEDRLQWIREDQALWQRFHYDELDPSPLPGTDMVEPQSIYWPAEQKKSLKYDIYIFYRDGNVHETLEINTPENRRDWQYRMNVVHNGQTVINCRDPRFPASKDVTDEELPGCFPEYEGRLPK